MLDLDTRWELHPRVALRPESFGALLYHFGTRKLSFLKSPQILEIVRSLAAHGSARTALRAAGLSDDVAGPYVRALAQLADSDMITPAAPAGTPAASGIAQMTSSRSAAAAADSALGAPEAHADRPDTRVRLIDRFETGLAAPICLTWELTYACNLSCVHCLSSSGRRDPRELSTEQCKALIDEFERMQVF
jgi:mycofactocin biosynthetic radical S-adenosylmethionine protein MftC